MGEPSTPTGGTGTPSASDQESLDTPPVLSDAPGDAPGDAPADSPPPGTKAELMRRVHDGWAELERAIARLTDSQLTHSTADGEWSIQDHLAHLAAWERILLARLRGEPEREHEAAGMVPEAYDAADLDEVNQAIQQGQPQRTLAQALDDFRATHLRLTAHLDGLTWKDLSNPDRTGAPELPLLGTTVGNTYAHYAEHLATIHALAADTPERPYDE